MLGDWGSHLNFDLLVVVSKDIASENVKSFIAGVFEGALDDSFSDDPRLVVSDLEFSNGFFNGVFRAVVVGDDK